MALGLLELGVRPGDVVSYQLPNWTEFLVLHHAATRIGAVNNPLIPIYRDREVGFMVGLAESKVLVVPQEFRGYDYPAMVERLRPQWPALQHVLVVGSRLVGGVRRDAVGGAPRPGGAGRRAARRERPHAADLHLRHHRRAEGRAAHPQHADGRERSPAGPLDVGPSDVIHMASTFAHLTGFLYGVRLPVQVGGATAVYQDVWNAEEFTALVEKHRITSTSAATPFLHDTLNTASSAARDLSSLRLFCCFGAPIPRAIVREARRRLPGLTVLGGWGQSENALVTLGIPGDPEEKLVERDGYPFPGMEIRVVDFDGTPLPAGQEGRVQVRGPFLFAATCTAPS